MDSKDVINEMKDESLRMGKPNVEEYDKAIKNRVDTYIIFSSILFGLTLIVEIWVEDWVPLLFATILIVAVGIIGFYFVKDILAARKDALAAYRKEEMKLACVYEKVMDLYFDEVKEKCNQGDSIDERLDKLAVKLYLESLKKADFENSELKERVEKLKNKPE